MQIRPRVLPSAFVAALAACSSSGSGPSGSGSTSGDAGESASSSGQGSGSGSGSPTSSSGGASSSSGSSGSASSSGSSSSGSGASSSSGSGSSSGSSGSSSGDGGSSGSDGGTTVNCSTPFPSGGNTYTGNGVSGTADGLNYGIWSNGSGGSITVFPNAHAFGASWNNGGDFLAHLGLDFDGSKSYTAYGKIIAQFVETKTGTAGGYSFIGMYGWTHNPCVEWYVDDDSFNGLQKTNITATIDGATYYLSTNMTTGSGGNACEAGHTGPWAQMWSYRQTPRQCGTITVSDHFAAWKNQGWSLGNLYYVHINVEVGGGNGNIKFPVADVTTNN